MSEVTEQNPSGESFAELFGSVDRSFKEGEIAKGRVLSIDPVTRPPPQVPR